MGSNLTIKVKGVISIKGEEHYKLKATWQPSYKLTAQTILKALA